MSTTTKQSRWGSFLQQAVAGVEARLDTILTDAEDGPAPSPKQQGAATPETADTSTGDARVSRSRSPATMTRAHDKLQARLARAIAARSASSTPPPTPSSKGNESGSIVELAGLEPVASPSGFAISLDPVRIPELNTDPTLSVMDTSRGEFTVTINEDDGQRSNDPALVPHTHSHYQSGLDVDDFAEAHNEEIRGYIEQIETLQAKLLYFAKDFGSSARNSLNSSTPGSIEHKLAERDERYALLLQEGHRMAKNEQRYRCAIRRLIAQDRASATSIRELSESRDAALAELASLRAAEAHTNQLNRLVEMSADTIKALNDEVAVLRQDVEDKLATIQSLESDIQTRDRRDSDTPSGTARRINELEEELKTLKNENKLVMERERARVAEFEIELNRARDNAQQARCDRDWELKSMENKLEAARSRAEDASSQSAGDTHLAVVRQLETLQLQYAAASKNWEGIEASLIARSSRLENERDQALCRESELRKKARDSALRSKEELLSLRTVLENKQREIDDRKREAEHYHLQLTNIQKQMEESERAAAQMRGDCEKHQLTQWDRTATDQDSRQWAGDLARDHSHFRSASPLSLVPQRTLSSDLFLLYGVNKTGHTSSPQCTSDGFVDSVTKTQRTSVLPHISRSMQMEGVKSPCTSVRSSEFLQDFYIHSPPAQEDRDIVFTERRLVPSQQDVISVSTSTAGPSVQLVERMSTAIRRLEAEKVSTREELVRVCGQRDEARAEISSLMKQVGEQRLASEKMAVLQKEVTDLNSRYQTTLEMLGEKSELVDELRADIHDLKQMYRELVERAVK